MATRSGAAVLWSSAGSVTLSSASRVDSDAIALDATDVQVMLQVSADNAGTPASGDVVRVYMKLTSGDVLGDSGDDYDTDEHAIPLGTLDTYATNTPGEDPARRSWDITQFLGAPNVKLSVEAPQGASRSIVVKARIARLQS